MARLPVIRNVRQLRALSLDEASRGYPVHLRGTVTYSDASHGDLFIQDETGAVFVDRSTTDMADLLPGQRIEVEGITRPADFATDVSDVKMRVLSDGQIPGARKATAEELASGTLDCRRVEVEGVVRSAESYQNGWMLDIAAGAVQFKAYIPHLTFLSRDLVDARVRIRGTCGGFYNRRSQFIALEVLVPRIEDVAVTEAATQLLHAAGDFRSRHPTRRAESRVPPSGPRARSSDIAASGPLAVHPGDRRRSACQDTSEYSAAGG